jgi:hypothetical protein
MRKQLLRSYTPFIVEPRTLNESRRENNGRIVLTGLLQCADTPNGNGRIYPRTILEREVNRYKKVIEQNRALGELDHPPEKDWERDDPLSVRLDRASHIIRNIQMKGNEVRGEVQVLSTPAGKILEALLNDGVLLGISSRGFGSVEHNGQHSIVQEDIEISCWDMVWMPSTSNAFMEALNESKQSNFMASSVKVSNSNIEPLIFSSANEKTIQQAEKRVQEGKGSDVELEQMLRTLRSLK